MKKYRFYIPMWSVPASAEKHYRKVLADWIDENGGVKVPLYVKDDIYVWATDKDILHMVITSHQFDDLPKRLDNYGSDILDVLMDFVENRDVNDDDDDDDDYDPEEALYDYITE